MKKVDREQVEVTLVSGATVQMSGADFAGLVWRAHARAVEGHQAPLARKVPVLLNHLTANQGLADRAGRLLELYAEWFTAHRRGAKTIMLFNSVQFDEALVLVSTWDDARLAKLAQIVLTTDEDFISRTDRSFHIFCLRASWADDRLQQWEARQAR